MSLFIIFSEYSSKVYADQIYDDVNLFLDDHSFFIDETALHDVMSCDIQYNLQHLYCLKNGGKTVGSINIYSNFENFKEWYMIKMGYIHQLVNRPTNFSDLLHGQSLNLDYYGFDLRETISIWENNYSNDEILNFLTSQVLDYNQINITEINQFIDSVP